MGISGLFFKVICEEVDVFGKQIYEDRNVGNLDEAKQLIHECIAKHPNAKLELYPMRRCGIV